MITRKINPGGFELNFSVPESVEEYNSLAPKRLNPCLEDAIQNTLYRGVYAEWRDTFAEKLGTSTGIKRINSGTEEDPVWESEGKYFKRVLVEWAKGKSLDPAAKATKDAFLAEFTPLAQSVADGLKFDPSIREATGGAPKLAKAWVGIATEAVNKDGGVALCEVLKGVRTKFSLDVAEPVVDTANKEATITSLARVIAANEKRKADERAAQAKAEYAA